MRGERGLAMIWALLVVFTVATTSALLFERSGTIRLDTGRDLADTRAFHAAEGGLAHARHALAGDAGFPGAKLTVGDCRVESKVSRADEGWIVDVIANPGDVRIRATLRSREEEPVVSGWRRLR